VKAEATAEQKAAAESAQKTPPTSQQLARQEAASKDHNLQASVNKGHPNPNAIKSFNKSAEQGSGAQGAGAAAGAGKAETGAGNKQNVAGNQAKVHSGKATGYKSTAHTPHPTIQKSHYPATVVHHPPTGASHGYSTGQPQPKKKSGKPAQPEGQPR